MRPTTKSTWLKRLLAKLSRQIYRVCAEQYPSAVSLTFILSALEIMHTKSWLQPTQHKLKLPTFCHKIHLQQHNSIKCRRLCICHSPNVLNCHWFPPLLLAHTWLHWRLWRVCVFVRQTMAHAYFMNAVYRAVSKIFYSWNRRLGECVPIYQLSLG